MAYLLPLTSDGERTFSVVLGSNTYFFRSYYVRGQESACLLDISDAGGSMLASGVQLVPGFPEGEESPFTLGDPMETLGEAIRLAGE